MADLHERYLHLPILDITALQTASDEFKVNPLDTLHRLIRFYNGELTKAVLDANKLDICRMLLCYEYRLVYGSSEEGCRDKRCAISYSEGSCFSNIREIFSWSHPPSPTETLILRDIVIMQMLLYCDIGAIKQHLADFLQDSDSYSADYDSRVTHIRMLDYFLQSLRLHRFLYSDASDPVWQELSSMYLKAVKPLLRAKDDNNWREAILILPVLINTFTSESILLPLWNCILHEMDPKVSLAVLSVIADVLFASCSINTIDIRRNIYCDNAFWSLILNGLRLSVQQYRKQALYLMQKAIDAINDFYTSDGGLIKAKLTPFICSKFCDKALSRNRVKEDFFLLFEALEEKQYHLVIPALNQIASLVAVYKEHKVCNGCFDIAWLRCIFEKILLHENNNVVKWGISYICKLDENVFDDEFIELFVNVLNNTFLYECQSKGESPQVVNELSTLLSFIFITESQANLRKQFLKAISKVNWGPVAIFYIMHILQRISSEKTRQNNWDDIELDAMKSLVERNLSVHSHILRTASQIELLRAIPNYVQKIDNLTLLANFFGVFPSGEAFTRGTSAWNIITTWLPTVSSRSDALNFVLHILKRNTCSEINPRTFALMIFLLHDANLIFTSTLCPAEHTLSNWLGLLNSINMRPYADIQLNINIIEFISHALNISITEPSNKVMELISPYAYTGLKYLIRNVKKIAIKLTHENYTKYVAIASAFILNADLFISKKDMDCYIEKVQNDIVCLLKDTQQREKSTESMQCLYELHILYLSQNILILPSVKDFYFNHLINTKLLTDNNPDMTHLKGKIVSEYYLILTQLLHQYLISSEIDKWIPTDKLLVHLLQFLEFGGAEIVPKIATVLTVMINNKVIKDTKERENFGHIFHLCWKYTFFNKKNIIFWTTIRNLVGVIINDDYMSLPDAADFTVQFVDKLIEDGNNTPKFKRILLCRMESLHALNLMKLKIPLLDCLLHGSVLRRDKKIENHAHAFIAKHLEQYYPKHVLALAYNNDAAVRAHAAVILHRMISESRCDNADVIALEIIDMLDKYKNKRYFNDSNLHKLKHRLMQVLLILQPALTEIMANSLYEKLCNFISSESNQHSVRLMQEWLMIRILKANKCLYDKLWKFFQESIENRPGCTISAASIVYHVAHLLSDEEQKSFILTALPYVARCCLGQQFNTRLYNQFVIIKLYELMKGTNDDDIEISEYKAIYHAAVASWQQEKFAKNSTKIQDDFYFSNFHPIHDYSLQTIYHEWPRLTNLSYDEWFSGDEFKAFKFAEYEYHPLKLFNSDLSLSKTETSLYRAKSTDDKEPLADNDDDYLENFHNIQKKIVPSKSTAALSADFSAEMKELMYQQNLQLSHEGLIVVASFVSRPANLGGIARTCEIFGVKTLIVANLDYIKTKEFQSLSVTAEKWIRIKEVKPHALQEYLLEKKNAGWTVIGIEQTAKSINLLETRFHKKTILILGNERNGIPANFIPLFDGCVEIPQVGVIRSLNVHVTAAICIWRYASQNTLT